MFSLVLLASTLLTGHGAAALNNGVQKLPRLGYNSAYRSCITLLADY